MSYTKKGHRKVELNHYCDFCYEVAPLYPVLIDKDDPDTKLFLCDMCSKTWETTQKNMQRQHEERVVILHNAINGIISNFKAILS